MHRPQHTCCCGLEPILKPTLLLLLLFPLSQRSQTFSLVCFEIQRDLFGGDQLTQHCVNLGSAAVHLFKTICITGLNLTMSH